MKNFLFIMAVSALALQSCEKCQTCKCYKSGMMTEENECVKSTDADDYFRYWQNQLIDEKGYEQCDCRYD